VAFFDFNSLRTRYIMFATALLVLVLAGGFFGHRHVAEASMQSTENLVLRDQMLEEVRKTRTGLFDAYKTLDAFLLDPSRQEYYQRVQMHFLHTITLSNNLSGHSWLSAHHAGDIARRLSENLKQLNDDVEILMRTRLDRHAQYPSLDLGNRLLRPNRNRFNNAMLLALSETREAEEGPLKITMLSNFLEARHYWDQMVSNFRLYLANRMGTFDEAALPKQEKSVTILYQALMGRLQLLKEMDADGNLGFQASISLEELLESAEAWYQGFLGVKEIHNSGNWRTDISFIKTAIEPRLAHVADNLAELERLLDESATKDLSLLAQAAKLQEQLFMLTMLFGVLFIVVIILSMERLVFRPMAEVSSGLRAIAFGKEGEVLPEARSRETGMLVDAFGEMSRQVRARQADLRHQALHDALTGLPNRILLQDRIDHAIQEARRRDEHLILLMLDLNRFKEVNDTLGHNVGDHLLIEVGKCIAGQLRKVDTVARLGGDEFAILLSNADLAFGEKTAKKIGDALEAGFMLDGLKLYAAASIGVAVYPEHGANAHALLQRADVAMYVAKRKQIGFSTYDVSQDEHSVGRLSLMGDLHDALEADELHLHFQPKVSLTDGSCVGAEALLRWKHDKFGQIPPDQIIPLAEQTGLIQSLTYWVLDKALAQCALWRQQGLMLPVSVNLSVLNLQDEEMAERVRTSLEQHGLLAQDLVLEITESAMMANPASSVEKLTDIYQMGIPLSIDDFGTGFSSLAYLKDLPVTELKLDKSFITDLCVGAEDEVIVRSTIELAHNLGLRVVAEGVETDDTHKLLQIYGCDQAQGYFYNRPIEGSKMLGWLKQRNEIATNDANTFRE